MHYYRLFADSTLLYNIFPEILLITTILINSVIINNKMKKEINIGKVEELIKEKFYNREGHGVDVTNVLEREGRLMEVTYKYSINGVYQSTHDVELTREEIKKCYVSNYPDP